MWICTPDKDLGQCVGGKVFQYDRRKQQKIDRNGVRAKFGVEAESIPDYLALVGDSADGFPGLPGWGAKSAATVLAHYRHLEQIPDRYDHWDVSLRGAVRGAKRLASTLAENRELALLFRRIATAAPAAPVSESVDALEWRGPKPELEAIAQRLEAPDLAAQRPRAFDRAILTGRRGDHGTARSRRSPSHRATFGQPEEPKPTRW